MGTPPPTYNVDVKVIVGDASDIGEKIKNVINAIDGSKTIHSISLFPVGTSRIACIIIHDQ
ncbi:MAG: hypothetical protein QXF58_05100 [Desulfurococcaceae archaeon]